MNEKKEMVETVVVWPATSCIVDEAGCVNPVQAISAMISFQKTLIRFVLAGDHLQLPAFIESPKTKELWTKSFLKDCKDKGIPCVQLDIQYRQHEDLFAAVNKIIYNGLVRSFYSTTTPRPVLQDLQQKLPVSFVSNDSQYTLTSFSHLVNVSHGLQESKFEGSSCNVAEVDTIEAMIKALIVKGISLNKVVIMSGYLWQLERLQTMADANGWSNLLITLTLDTCQGGEWEVNSFRFF